MLRSRFLKADSLSSIRKAAAILSRGGLVAFPTETVYALGADAFNPRAVCRIFEVKKRPAFDPLIVHVAGFDGARALWQKTPRLARALMERFWPGPLTLVLAKKPVVPDIVTAGFPTAAVRMPDHPVALRLIEELKRPIAAPSANFFGYTSPTSAASVFEDLGDEIDLVLDGGRTPVGIESTVLKIDGNDCLLLRPGGVPLEEIKKVAPAVRRLMKNGSGNESPGLLKSHYAPWTPLAMMDKSYDRFIRELGRLRRAASAQRRRWPRLGLISFKGGGPAAGFRSVEVLSARGDLDEAASNLFQAIRKLDKMKLDLIIAEPVPEKGIGMAIMDRLKKASGGKRGIEWNHKPFGRRVFPFHS